MQVHGWALRYVPAFWNDKEVVLAAVRNNCALFYVKSNVLYVDKDVVLAETAYSIHSEQQAEKALYRERMGHRFHDWRRHKFHYGMYFYGGDTRYENIARHIRAYAQEILAYDTFVLAVHLGRDKHTEAKRVQEKFSAFRLLKSIRVRDCINAFLGEIRLSTIRVSEARTVLAPYRHSRLSYTSAHHRRGILAAEQRSLDQEHRSYRLFE